MEYTRGNYKHKRGTIFTTSDGLKYAQYNVRSQITYLRCVLYKDTNKCKGSARLKIEFNTIVPLNPHNHPISHYRAGIFDLKLKCLNPANSSRLSKVFKQVVREDPPAVLVSYRSLEATMYRARREIKPPIPRTPIEFLEMLPSSQFSIYFKGGVQVGCDVGMVFFSDKMATTLSKVEDVYFDGTFYTVQLGFSNVYHSNQNFRTLIRAYMSLPFLPAE